MSDRLCKLAFVVMVVLLPLSLVDYAALHDIWWDYASETLVKRFSYSGVERWPEWTRAEGEWVLVRGSLIIRTSLIVLNLALLGTVLRRQRVDRRETATA